MSSATFEGFIHSIRDQKNVIFFVLRDWRDFLQAVVDKSKPELLEQASKLTKESFVRMKGELVKNDIVKLGGRELQVKQIEILSLAESPLPLQPWDEKVKLSKRLDWRWLDLRSPKNNLLFEIESFLESKFLEFFVKRWFKIIHSPKLMGAPSESGAELFEVKYFDRIAYLAQSPQFYKQMAIASGFEKVVEIWPVFRANPSFTSRHDTEFVSFDIEMAGIVSYYDLIKLETALIRFLVRSLQKRYQSEIKKYFGIDLNQYVSLKSKKITFEQAIKLLKKLGYTNSKQEDLDSEWEKILGEYFSSKGIDLLYIVDYPIEGRPFYHMRDEARWVSLSYDLLFKWLEITTGAQREHRYEILRQQAIKKWLNTSKIDFYLNFFRRGCPPHGGFGFGFTRLIMKLLGFNNVREVTYVYRGPNRLTP